MRSLVIYVVQRLSYLSYLKSENNFMSLNYDSLSQFAKSETCDKTARLSHCPLNLFEICGVNNKDCLINLKIFLPRAKTTSEKPVVIANNPKIV